MYVDYTNTSRRAMIHLNFPPPAETVETELVIFGTVDFFNVKDDEAPILPVTVPGGV